MAVALDMPGKLGDCLRAVRDRAPQLLIRDLDQELSANGYHPDVGTIRRYAEEIDGDLHDG